jgi:nucleoside-diphosphate-sugar epimerase
MILVTGGAGRLGFEVVKLLSLDGFEVMTFDLPNVDWSRIEALHGVRVFKGDITNPNQFSIVKQEVDAVIHLAALMPPNSERNRDLTFKMNIQGTKNVLNSFGEVTSIVFASSISTYGITANVSQPIDESRPLAAHDNYSESKIAGEVLIRGAGKPFTILRIAPISVVDLVELPEVVPYRGDQRVEFIYVEDAAQAVRSALNLTGKRETYNIAGGSSWQMKGEEYIERFYRALGVDMDPNFSKEYTATDWYDTRKSAPLNYQNTSFHRLEEKLKALGEEFELR